MSAAKYASTGRRYVALRSARAQRTARVQRTTARGIRPAQRGFVRTAGYYGTTRIGASNELKFHDVTLDDAVVSGTGTITPSINLIAQDNTESGRDGRKCTVRAINWRYRVELPEQDAQGTPAGMDTVRVILYQDKQCNGATATVTGILETANFLSFNNLANKGRFMILMDRTHDLNYQTLASDGAGVVSQANYKVSGSFYKKCVIPLEFDSTTGAITEIRSNNLGVLLISASAVAGFESQFRLRFSG